MKPLSEAGLTIVKAEQGGGFLLIKDGTPEQPVRQTRTWFKEVSEKYEVDEDELIKELALAQSKPKKTPQIDLDKNTHDPPEEYIEPSTCQECGAIMDDISCPKCSSVKKLSDYGCYIRKAEQGGGFIFYQGEEPLESIKDTDKWFKEASTTYKVPIKVIKAALVKAKAKPKTPAKKKADNSEIEIYTGELTHLSPDQGVLDGRAYLGVFLPCKITDPEIEVSKIVYKHHLLFSDGELILATPQALSEKGIYLTNTPVFSKNRVPLDIILNLSNYQPVDPKQVFQKISSQLMRYMEFDDPRYYTLITTWIIGTYFYKHFATYPYLLLNAVKRAGKSKLLSFISLIGYNAVFSPDMTSSSMFRLIQNNGATILLDETESLQDPEKLAAIRSLLLSGYKKGPVVYRSEKDENGNFHPVPYDVYSPKALANINGVEDIMEDRTLSIILKRGLNKIIMNRELPLTDPIWEEIRGDLARLSLDRWEDIKNTYDLYNIDVVSGVCDVSGGYNETREKNNNSVAEKISLVGRDWELWKPIYSVSKTLFYSLQVSLPPSLTSQTSQTSLNSLDTVYEQIKKLSIKMVNDKAVDNATSTGEAILVTALLYLVAEHSDSWHTPGTIAYEANQITHGDISDWFNAKWVGHALKRLGFTEKRASSRGAKYRFTPDTVQDTADRLGVTLPEDDDDGGEEE